MIAIAMPLAELAQKVVTNLKQSGEWTKDDDDKFDKKLADRNSKDAWQVKD